MSNIGIGRLSALTGVKIATVRFYEQIGLLPPPMRTTGDQRRYEAGSVKRLTFIRHARDLGFDVEEIRALIRLADQPDQSCKSVDALAREHVEQIDAKIRKLRAMRRELMRSINACEGPRVKNCRIIEALEAPALRRRG